MKLVSKPVLWKSKLGLSAKLPPSRRGHCGLDKTNMMISSIIRMTMMSNMIIMMSIIVHIAVRWSRNRKSAHLPIPHRGLLFHLIENDLSSSSSSPSSYHHHHHHHIIHCCQESITILYKRLIILKALFPGRFALKEICFSSATSSQIKQHYSSPTFIQNRDVIKFGLF